MEKIKLDSEKVMRIWKNSQAELARQIGCSRSLLNYYLRNGSLAGVKKIAEILGVEPKDLIQ